ncbi:MAG TPA: ABC transporter permease [Streptosporangiaceae bacterium]|nr:ABC transporter permease [Streptosporangiaceae bacterium]
MRERARDQEGGPGTLTDDLVIPEVDPSALADEPLADLAARYGLRPSAARPGVFVYARQLWERRHFIVGFATARNIAMYTEARLGQLWQVLTPLLNAAVYYLIFGIILDTSRGVPNFLAFLITGIFIFNFTQRAFITTSRVMPDSLPLIRALPFPRACLPIGYVLIELEQLVMSMIVLTVIVLASGEPLTWYWLLAIPALAFQAVFNIGMGLSLARLGAGADDFSQLLPFLVRTWLYASGVMFSIQTIGSLRHHPTLTYLLQINPAAVYIGLVRNAILQSQRIGWPGSKPYSAANCALYHTGKKAYLEYSAYCHGTVPISGLWLWGVGWAIVALVAGFVFFWQGETRYGRG